MALDGPEITAVREACRRLGIYASPNVYLKQGSRRYDASLMIGPDGALRFLAGNKEDLFVMDLPLEEARQARQERPWLTL